jgi:acyl carrier protein
VTESEILATFQKGYDVVKPKSPRAITRDDRIVDDLGLDSLDFIDLVSVLEDAFAQDVVDAVIDRVPELTTVGDVVDAFLVAAA